MAEGCWCWCAGRGAREASCGPPGAMHAYQTGHVGREGGREGGRALLARAAAVPPDIIRTRRRGPPVGRLCTIMNHGSRRAASEPTQSIAARSLGAVVRGCEANRQRRGGGFCWGDVRDAQRGRAAGAPRDVCSIPFMNGRRGGVPVRACFHPTTRRTRRARKTRPEGVVTSLSDEHGGDGDVRGGCWVESETMERRPSTTSNPRVT